MDIKAYVTYLVTKGADMAEKHYFGWQKVEMTDLAAVLEELKLYVQTYPSLQERWLPYFREVLETWDTFKAPVAS